MSLLRFRRNRPAVTSHDHDRHRAWRLEALRLDYPKAHTVVAESDAAATLDAADATTVLHGADPASEPAGAAR
ncbi:hypothetical protein ACFXHA_25130 [Nocardia sp. NPDC059240]|uniref:hypothetical protein n=1 Tax=Nocardia sp. NPDC059240 TaxID=3346786 RepID=UPI0036A0870C